MTHGNGSRGCAWCIVRYVGSFGWERPRWRHVDQPIFRSGDDTLIQAGTRQDVFSFGGIEYSTHQVFRQVFPQTNAYCCSNCSLAEGDQLQFSAQFREPDGSGGGIGLLTYRNVTQQESASVEVRFSGGFTGGSAEWIMEDPRAQGYLLPNFGTLTFTDMLTYSDATGYQDFGASSYDTYAIHVNDHDYCTARVRSGTSIEVTRQPD